MKTITEEEFNSYTQERFKPIEGLEGYYIGDQGTVLSTIGTFKERKPSKAGRGYLQVNIKDHHYYIHRLVAETWIGNPDNLPAIDHINRIKTDNRVENLRFVTYGQNMQNTDRYKDGRSKDKEYVKEYQRNWRLNNLEHVKAVAKEYELRTNYHKHYYEDNRTEILEKKKEYHQSHKEERALYGKEYYELNRERILNDKKEYYATHKEQSKTRKNQLYTNGVEIIKYNALCARVHRGTTTFDQWHKV